MGANEAKKAESQFEPKGKNRKTKNQKKQESGKPRDIKTKAQKAKKLNSPSQRAGRSRDVWKRHGDSRRVSRKGCARRMRETRQKPATTTETCPIRENGGQKGSGISHGRGRHSCRRKPKKGKTRRIKKAPNPKADRRGTLERLAAAIKRQKQTQHKTTYPA